MASDVGFDGLRTVSQGDRAVVGDSVAGNSGMDPARSLEVYNLCVSSDLAKDCKAWLSSLVLTSSIPS